MEADRRRRPPVRTGARRRRLLPPRLLEGLRSSVVCAGLEGGARRARPALRVVRGGSRRRRMDGRAATGATTGPRSLAAVGLRAVEARRGEAPGPATRARAGGSLDQPRLRRP